MVTIRTQIDIKAPIELCFDMARNIELHTKTVWKHTRERAIAGRTIGMIEMGEQVTFEAPYGLAGREAERLILSRYMRNFLNYRNSQLKLVVEECHAQSMPKSMRNHTKSP